MDRGPKLSLPPRAIELDSDLNRRSILEFANGTPLSVIILNTGPREIDPSEVHEAETWQRHSANDGGI